MKEILIGLSLGLVFFLCTIKAYTLGLKHGKQLSNNNVPSVNINPVKSFKEYIEAKEVKKQQDLVSEGLNNIANYNPYDVKKEGE